MQTEKRSIDMENWKGSRITGIDSVHLLSFFDKKLESRSIQIVNTTLEAKFSEYEPWMSSSLCLNEFSILHRNERFPSILIKKQLELLTRKRLFSQDRNNLKRIHPETNGLISVMETSEPNYATFIYQAQNSIGAISKLNTKWELRLSLFVKELIPQSSNNPTYTLRKKGTGLSTFKYRKGILMSPSLECSSPILEFSLNLAHEIGHQALIIYQSIDKLILNQEKKIFSVIRKEQRYAILSFHAMIAVAYMIELLSDSIYKRYYWDSNKKDLLERLNFHINDLSLALKEISRLQMSKLGKQIYWECSALLIWAQLTYERNKNI